MYEKEHPIPSDLDDISIATYNDSISHLTDDAVEERFREMADRKGFSKVRIETST